MQLLGGIEHNPNIMHIIYALLCVPVDFTHIIQACHPRSCMILFQNVQSQASLKDTMSSGI